MTVEDHYRTLGVAPNASRDEIVRAYRALALENHPDHNPGNQLAEARMKRINRAWSVLSDPSRRALYDTRRRRVASPPPLFKDGGSTALMVVGAVLSLAGIFLMRRK